MKPIHRDKVKGKPSQLMCIYMLYNFTTAKEKSVQHCGAFMMYWHSCMWFATPVFHSKQFYNAVRCQGVLKPYLKLN